MLHLSGGRKLISVRPLRSFRNCKTTDIPSNHISHGQIFLLCQTWWRKRLHNLHSGCWIIRSLLATCKNTWRSIRTCIISQIKCQQGTNSKPHIGVEGNEMADQLANKGADTRFIGPEPCFCYNSNKHKRTLSEWIEHKKRIHFDNLPPNSLARKFLSYSSKRTELVLKLTDIKTLTGILTGHCGF